MENFIYYFIGYFFGINEKRITAFIAKQIFKLKYVFSKKKVKKYNDFYECSFDKSDFENESDDA